MDPEQFYALRTALWFQSSSMHSEQLYGSRAALLLLPDILTQGTVKAGLRGSVEGLTPRLKGSLFNPNFPETYSPLPPP